MTTRILYINPLGTDMYDEYTYSILQPAACPDTELVVRSLKDVPKTPYLPPAAYFTNQLLHAVTEGEKEGFDGISIGCCADPGVEDAKRLVNIPVSGPFEALAHTAPALGRVTIIAGRKNGSSWNHLVHRYNMAPWLASVREAHFAHPDPDMAMRLFEQDESELRRIVVAEMDRAAREDGVEQARLALEEDGADAVFFACTLWSGLLEPVARAVPVTVLDPMITALKYIEMVAATRRYYNEYQLQLSFARHSRFPVSAEAVPSLN
ncbi:MAG: aspartate/glutamate racemase family protein [Caldilineaceae bacterium]|nr:aspartate/glutamate racemase family protein [Caldilineaceae bacterium]